MNLIAFGILFIIGLTVFGATFGIALGRELMADIRHCMKLAKKRREMEKPLTVHPRRQDAAALALGRLELRF